MPEQDDQVEHWEWCPVPGCDLRAIARGFCVWHYPYDPDPPSAQQALLFPEDEVKKDGAGS